MPRRDDYSIWEEKFLPIEQGKDNIRWETYGEDLEKVKSTPPEYIWTLVDTGGKLYITSGYRYVNRLNYFLCKNPWTSKSRDYKY